MSANPLNAGAVARAMADALPTHEQDDSTSDLSSSVEAVALFSHACMANLGFRLLGLNEEQKTEAECQRLAPRLPSQWNSRVNAYSFVYAHAQSSMQFVIKTDRLGGRAEVRGLAVGDERIHRFELAPRDYVSSAALPLRIGRVADSGAEDRSDLEEKLRRVFISEERMADLASLLKINIIQRLLPSLQKEGYQEENPDDRAARQDAESASRSGARPSHIPPPPFPVGDAPPRVPIPGAAPAPLGPGPFFPEQPPPPHRPVPDFLPPGFEDEHEIQQQHRRPPLGGPDRSPFDIGHDDLNPPGLAPHDPLRGSFVPGGGLPRPGGFGGMHPTFDDPLFGGPRGGEEGGGFDPQAPPGARWDPLGPGGAPRFGGRPGRGGFGGGFGRGGFGGDII